MYREYLKDYVFISLIVGVFTGIVFLVIGLCIAISDVQRFEPVEGTDCINVVWQDNRMFGDDDTSRSGMYCPK